MKESGSEWIMQAASCQLNCVQSVHWDLVLCCESSTQKVAACHNLAKTLSPLSFKKLLVRRRYNLQTSHFSDHKDRKDQFKQVWRGGNRGFPLPWSADIDLKWRTSPQELVRWLNDVKNNKFPRTWLEVNLFTQVFLSLFSVTTAVIVWPSELHPLHSLWRLAFHCGCLEQPSTLGTQCGGAHHHTNQQKPNHSIQYLTASRLLTCIG